MRPPAELPDRAGRNLSPRGDRPAAMAPDETRTISRLASLAPSQYADQLLDPLRVDAPSAVVSDDEPTLITTRRACCQLVTHRRCQSRL